MNYDYKTPICLVFVQLSIANIYLLLLQDTALLEEAMVRFQHQCHRTTCISQSEVGVSNLRENRIHHYQKFQWQRLLFLMFRILLFQKYFHVPMLESCKVICCIFDEFEEAVTWPPEESKNISDQLLLKHRIVVFLKKSFTTPKFNH